MEFSEKLKLLRKQRGISQQALADAIFVSRSAVAKWENGLGMPSEQSMDALRQFFEVEEEALCTDCPEQLLLEKNRSLCRWRCSLVVVLVVVVLAVLLVAPYTKQGMKWTVRLWQPSVTRYAEQLRSSPQEPNARFLGWRVRRYDEAAVWFERTHGAYTGLIYSADGEPKGFQGAEMTFYRFGSAGVSRYLWAEENGDNWMMLERIDEHWFWYKMHF